jgi:hypothetical protein
MFGLSQREQRWAAEQKAAELLVTVAVAAMKASADIEVAKAKTDSSELVRLTSENTRVNALADKWNLECDEMREDNKRLTAELAERDDAEIEQLTETSLWQAGRISDLLDEVAVQRKVLEMARRSLMASTFYADDGHPLCERDVERHEIITAIQEQLA